MITANENLRPHERKLFDDPNIENAYQQWSKSLTDLDPKTNTTRKQFLMRMRFLIQQGAI